LRPERSFNVAGGSDDRSADVRPSSTPYRPSRPRHPRTALRRRGQGDVPERSNRRPSHPPRLRSRRVQTSMSTLRRRQGTFSPPLLQPKSIKASSRSARCVGIAIKAISNSLRLIRVSYAEEVLPTPTICDLPNRARWDARSATSSRYRYVERITGTIIASAMKSAGGRDGLLIRSRPHGCFGSQPDLLNKNEKPAGGGWAEGRDQVAAIF
jgi:hypothetical protein